MDTSSPAAADWGITISDNNNESRTKIPADRKTALFPLYSDDKDIDYPPFLWTKNKAKTNLTSSQKIERNRVFLPGYFLHKHNSPISAKKQTQN
jgi:hypothetical protein